MQVPTNSGFVHKQALDEVVTEYDRDDLTDPDSTVKNTYSKYMDRILAAMRFRCDATSTDGKGNSHLSVMAAISTFREDADPLNGTRLCPARADTHTVCTT